MLLYILMQVIIFVKSIQRCMALAQLLVEQNFPAIAIHKAMTQDERYVTLAYVEVDLLIKCRENSAYHVTMHFCWSLEFKSIHMKFGTLICVICPM